MPKIEFSVMILIIDLNIAYLNKFAILQNKAATISFSLSDAAPTLLLAVATAIK